MFLSGIVEFGNSGLIVSCGCNRGMSQSGNSGKGNRGEHNLGMSCTGMSHVGDTITVDGLFIVWLLFVGKCSDCGCNGVYHGDIGDCMLSNVDRLCLFVG